MGSTIEPRNAASVWQSTQVTNMVSHEETVISLLSNLQEDIRRVDNKADQIILRNSNADVKIGELKQLYTSHENHDNQRFSQIESKVSKIDGRMWKGIGSLLALLIAAIIGFLKLK